MCHLMLNISLPSIFLFDHMPYHKGTMSMKIWLLLIPLMVIAQCNTTKASIDAKTYIVHMDKTKTPTSHIHSSNNRRHYYEALLQSTTSSPTTTELLYVYETAISGFAAKLSNDQVNALSKTNGFLNALPDELLALHTTHSPQFLGLNMGQGLWGAKSVASDVIIGVLDTGIWPEHVSFSDHGIASHVPLKWKGVCESGTNFSRTNCNKKLIGARAFFKGYEALFGRINETTDYRSPRDSQGHGTHTASTVGGDLVANANFFGLANGTAAGMKYTSRIAAYKVCWRLGCTNSDLLAAIDKGVADGVDVLSLSLGGTAKAFYNDNVAIASLGAIQKGVFVSCSAGNSGPTRLTADNTAPWIMTVAASYTDRSFPAIVKLGNGISLVGSSLYTGKDTKQLRLVYAATIGIKNAQGARYCVNGSFKKKKMKGKIVVCERGVTSRTEKGVIMKLLGAAGMLLISTGNQGEELFADPHVLPAATLGVSAGKAVINYINSTKRPTASIAFKGTIYGDRAPILAAFSSRGPGLIAPDVIKPDVTAPGVNILASWPPKTSPSSVKSDNRSVLFNIVSGTSMSCPHVSGLAALLMSVHKHWSPAAIKSALMTTAYVVDNRNSPIGDIGSNSPATPFGFGSGHVDPERASDPGLIYDIAPKDYLNFLCISLNYTSSQVAIVARNSNFTCPNSATNDLNYPSFAVNFKVDDVTRNFTITSKRSVTNAGAPISTYGVKIEEPSGVKVVIRPKRLRFEKLGQKLGYNVTFVNLRGNDATNGFSVGSIVWVSGKYTVRSPIAVTWN